MKKRNINRCLNDLPDGSALEIIPGGSHVAYVEKLCYHDFQARLLRFLLIRQDQQFFSLQN